MNSAKTCFSCALQPMAGAPTVCQDCVDINPMETKRPVACKYTGFVNSVADRLHLLDQETGTGSELSHTIRYLSYRNRVQVLKAVTMGLPGADTHHATDSPVLGEALGRSVNIRPALKGCGLEAPDSPAVSSPTRTYLMQVDNPALPRPIAARDQRQELAEPGQSWSQTHRRKPVVQLLAEATTGRTGRPTGSGRRTKPLAR